MPGSADLPEFHRIGSSALASPRILVLRGGALGDFILTLPALAALRRHFPHARLELIACPPAAQLALCGRLADRVLSIESPELAGFFAQESDLNPHFARYFADFDLVISYLYDPALTFQANLRRCSAARFIAGPHRPDESLRIHATEILLKPLEQLGILDADPVPRLDLAFRSPALLPPGKWLALHPGSGSERKNWPEAKWAQLLEWLASQTHLNLLLVGGEAEGDRVRRLAERLPAERVQFAHGLSLSELAPRLRSCLGYLGHDSGITHLAAALGLVGLVLWGHTDAAVWRPRSDKMTLLCHAAGLSELPVARVIERVRMLVPAA